MIVSLGVVFEGLSIVLCLHYLYGERVRWDMLTIGFVFLHFGVLMLANNRYIDSSWTLIIQPLIMLYCGKRFGWKPKTIIVNTILQIIILSLLQTSIMLILGVFFDIASLNIIVSTIINCLILIILIIVLRHCKLDRLSKILQSKERLIIYSLVVVVFGAIFSILKYKSTLSFDVSTYLVIAISIILIGLVALDIGKHKMKVRETEAELRLHKLYEQSYQSLVQDIRARQHEFKNHISAIHSQHFLYHTYNELIQAQKQYCDEVIKENYYNKLFSEGNPVILGFLYSKFKEAEKKGINISYRISIKELECNIPVYKMVELVGNLLNNAIDALCEDNELNSMSIVMTEQDDNIMIEIGNQCKNMDYSKLPELFKRGYSEKGEDRGYGLYNVKKICEDYQVQMENYIEEREGIKWLFFRMTVNKLLKKNR